MKAFDLGRVVVTAGVDALMQKDNNFCDGVFDGLRRHAKGDWGDLEDEDKQANEMAVLTGGRLLSAYQAAGEKIWIITEWDRSATTVLFPDEY